MENVELSLRPLSVMIGANGTGKTSVLDALWLLASPAQGKLTSSILDLAGLTSVLSHETRIAYYDPEKKKLLAPAWEHNPLETSLARVPKMFQEPEDFRSRLASSTFYHVLNVEPKSLVRLPQSVAPAGNVSQPGYRWMSAIVSAI